MAAYSSRGKLGDYSPSEQPFSTPKEVKFASGGYGADESDFRRGYADPDIAEKPDYDLNNYKERWTQPKVADDDDNPFGAMGDDYEFRNKDRRSKGFFTRPRIPTDR